MDVKSYKEILNLFFRKAAKIFNYFFPGMVILELVFAKGFFSNPPENIYSFMLYMIWSGIFSVPFHFIQPFSIEKFSENMIDLTSKKAGVSREEIKKSLDSDYKEELEELCDEFELGFMLIKLFAIYFLFKVLVFVEFPFSPFLSIPINVVRFLITLLSVIIISYPLGFVYTKIFFCLLSRLSKK